MTPTRRPRPTPKTPSCSLWRVPLVALLVVGLSGCAGFRRLGEDLKFIDNTAIVSAQVTNAGEHRSVYGCVVEWDREKDEVLSADFTKLEGVGAGELGLFGFFVKGTENQYVAAWSDRNGNQRYEPGEPAWIHSDESGTPVPMAFNDERKARSKGALSSSTKVPEGLIKASREFVGARTDEEAASKLTIPIALGDIADPEDAKFSPARGQAGYWEPARFPMEAGIGIYFLEKYDPNRIPVLFVYGAAGSPHDWNTFEDKIDRKKHQAWFYFYPTGRRLDEMGNSLNEGVKLLQAHYGFQKLHVIAHSMGGLVSRSFLIKNVVEDKHDYIDRFVSVSTPWQGHAAAEMGVKWAPSAIPSWLDMQTDSDFQKEIFSKKLKGRVDHLLIYGYVPKGDKPIEELDDGTVTVKSQTRPEAVEDAVKVLHYPSDHVEILSRDDVIREAYRFIGN